MLLGSGAWDVQHLRIRMETESGAFCQKPVRMRLHGGSLLVRGSAAFWASDLKGNSLRIGGLRMLNLKFR